MSKNDLQENFLPSFLGSNSVIEKEKLQEEVFSVTRPTSNSFPPPPPSTPDKTIQETLKGDNYNQRPDHSPSFDTKSDSEGAEAVQTEEKVLEEAEKSSWLLKIIYNIVSGGELITKLVQVQQTIRISSQNHQTSSFKRIIKP